MSLSQTTLQTCSLKFSVGVVDRCGRVTDAARSGTGGENEDNCVELKYPRELYLLKSNWVLRHAYSAGWYTILCTPP